MVTWHPTTGGGAGTWQAHSEGERTPKVPSAASPVLQERTSLAVWMSGETSLVGHARYPLVQPMPPAPALTSWGSSHRVAAGAAGSRCLPARPSADSPGSRCAAHRLQGLPAETRPSGPRTRGSGSWHSAQSACTGLPQMGTWGEGAVSPTELAQSKAMPRERKMRKGMQKPG